MKEIMKNPFTKLSGMHPEITANNFFFRTKGHPMTLDHCLHHFISSESVKDVVCDNCTKVCNFNLHNLLD